MAPRGDQKPRLDQLLVDQGLARSRGEAQALIMAGRVRVDGKVVDKAGRRLPDGVALDVEYPEHRYASRGGLKLEKALEFFHIEVSGRTCLDVGASTGGFTDCLLTRDASRVYAVDVGYGLLAWSLRTDPRVVPIERTNARYLTPESFRALVENLAGGPKAATPPVAAGAGASPVDAPPFTWPTFASCDVSFISLLKVVPAVRSLLEPPWEMVLLVKPQFEAGRDKVGSRGVVRDRSVHVEVLERVIDGLYPGLGGVPAVGGDSSPETPSVEPRSTGVVAGLTYSPVRGPEGNIEYLLWVKGGWDDGPGAVVNGIEPGGIRKVVDEAFGTVR